MGGPLSRRSLCLFFTRNQTKAELEISTRTEVGRECQSELEEGTHRRQLAKSDAVAVDNGQQKRPVGMRVAVREDQSGWVGIPSSFVEILLEIHASVSLQIHKECRVSQLNLLALELTQAHIVRLFFVLFLPLPWLYFLWP